MRVRIQLSRNTHTYVEVPDPQPCVHLGEAVRREDGLRKTVECLPCSAKSKIPIKVEVLACAVHGECTAEKPVDGLAWCGRCAERKT